MAKLKKTGYWSDKIPYLKQMKGFYSKIEHKGINLWPVMANEVYTYYRNQERGFLERLMLIIRFILFKEDFKTDKSKGKVLASYFMSREDHHELMKKALSEFSKEELFFLNAYKYKKNPLKNYKFTLPNLWLLLRIWNKFRKEELKKLLGIYYFLFIARTYQRYKQIDYFQKIVSKLEPKGYLAFCSPAFGEEAIMTLICKKKKIPTFSMQHGFLPNCSRSFTPVIVQNENNISDYFLVWGKSSYELEKNYIDKSCLLIVGNPKYSPLLGPIKAFSPKNATVFFSSTGSEESNKKMLQITNNFSSKYPEIKFNLKLHPFDNPGNYKEYISSTNLKFVDKNMSVGKLLEESDFIVVHNSSVAYEALFYKIPILIFKDKFFIGSWKNKGTFTNLNELEKLLSKLKENRIFKKFMRSYDKELKRMFYFHPKKTVPCVYYENVTKKINEFRKKKNIELHNV